MGGAVSGPQEDAALLWKSSPSSQLHITVERYHLPHPRELRDSNTSPGAYHFPANPKQRVWKTLPLSGKCAFLCRAKESIYATSLPSPNKERSRLHTRILSVVKPSGVGGAGFPEGHQGHPYISAPRCRCQCSPPVLTRSKSARIIQTHCLWKGSPHHVTLQQMRLNPKSVIWVEPAFHTTSWGQWLSVWSLDWQHWQHLDCVRGKFSGPTLALPKWNSGNRSSSLGNSLPAFSGMLKRENQCFRDMSHDPVLWLFIE